MFKSSNGIGDNPFTLNLISFTGHGLTFDGDAIGVIPQLEKIEEEIKATTRFINFSGYGRRLA
jgi:hypothetical protein